jgi:hypothetical protein
MAGRSGFNARTSSKRSVRTVFRKANQAVRSPLANGDIRGKTVVVDAPNTAFALILYKMLDLNGIKHDGFP